MISLCILVLGSLVFADVSLARSIFPVPIVGAVRRNVCLTPVWNFGMLKFIS